MYSQNSEEKFILEHFSNHIGTFLDVGANDGKTLSNSLALVELGWAGTLVECAPSAFERLYTLHGTNPKLTLLSYALGKENGILTLNESGELLGSGDVALVSSFKEEEVRRWNSLNMPFKQVEVPVVDFKTLQDHSPYKKYDFITIDIEGWEVEVIDQFDLDALETKLVCLEWNGNHFDAFDSYFKKFSFTLIHENQENLIYGR